LDLLIVSENRWPVLGLERNLKILDPEVSLCNKIDAITLKSLSHFEVRVVKLIKLKLQIILHLPIPHTVYHGIVNQFSLS
jgi:hypothetical protein